MTLVPSPASFFTVHIVGGGVMGVLAAHELRSIGEQLGLDVTVVVHEAGELGGTHAPAPRRRAASSGSTARVSSTP